MSLNHDDSQDAPQPKAKGKIATRRVARSLAMQALYQWHMAGQSLNEIEAQFRVDNDFSGVDGNYFHELLTGVARAKTEIDGATHQALDNEAVEAANDQGELALRGDEGTFDGLQCHRWFLISLKNEGAALQRGALTSFIRRAGILQLPDQSRISH